MSLILGSLISAGASLLGNILGNKSKDETNAMNMQIAQMNNATQEKWAQKNFDFQQEAAHQGIGWKVQDAISAGLHPLAALGSQTFSPSPVSINSSTPSLESKSYDFGSMGQDLGRAAKAVQDNATRQLVDEEEARKLDLEKKALENDVLKTELVSRINRSSRGAGMIGPPLPRPGPMRSSSGYAIGDDEMKSKDEAHPSVKRLPLWGMFDLETYPGRSSGQDLENEYGEYGGGALALPNILADAIYTYGPSGGFSFPAGSGSRIKRFRRGRYTAPSYRPWAE